ncbi:GyrI-like domain-containing protein [Actinoplanes subglobosus]|uniref:GyrI-like domain-containing protein n=1 Tax=Actinoplanes subglobosus TaxID=1547892 RepID=A0ABV8J8A3_9ACTN
MTAKTDFKRELSGYSARRGRFDIVDVPDLRYLMVDGEGDPNAGTAFGDAAEALYPVAYRLKFASKRAGRDYVVMPLEGLWWADDMESFTASRDKSRWHWTLMIMVPDGIDEDLVGDGVRLGTLSEGRCVQTLHVGPFDAEAETLERMHHEFIPANGLRMTGRHHEIYLSDPRRTAPERLRTILRQPVAPPREEGGAGRRTSG